MYGGGREKEQAQDTSFFFACVGAWTPSLAASRSEVLSSFCFVVCFFLF